MPGKTVFLFLASLGSTLVLGNTVPRNEFRGVWVATVVNIDWPPSPYSTVEEQKQSFIELVDFYAKLNFNALIVQIRTAGDAFYPSKLAPWSEYLTGEQGKAPEPLYDPLEFMISQCHMQGLEFHAWLNPYRATFNLDVSSLDDQHVYHEHPEWIVKYGPKYYLNPGKPQVVEHLVEIVEEVIDNYHVDAIHFDDYFYPYKIGGQIFDDELDYVRYGKSTFERKDDWRRSNVDTLVSRVYKIIKAKKSWVQFGISPFGIWRNSSRDPSGSKFQGGQTTFDDLYADPLNWVENGWVDYLVPQLYWSMDYKYASYRYLAGWWDNNVEGVDLYTGIGVYKVENNADSAWFDLEEVSRQLDFNRSLENVGGEVFFSAKVLKRKLELANRIKKGHYDNLVIANSVVLQDTPFALPDVRKVKLKRKKSEVVVRLNSPPDESVRYVLLLSRPYLGSGDTSDIILRERPHASTLIRLPLAEETFILTLAYMSHLNQVSTETTPTLIRYNPNKRRRKHKLTRF